MERLSFPYGGYANWQKFSQLRCQPYGILSQWLQSQDSLTERLKALDLGFEVEVLGEQAMMLCDNEKTSTSDEVYWVREVLLHLDNQPWIFARTVIPQSLLAISNIDFKQLGNRPLGEVLFNTTPFEQGPLTFAEHACDTPVFQAFAKDNVWSGALWGRRRPFHHQQKTLTVAETFLPAACAYLQSL
ncbi:chorismate--pyruvate lyase family protein [Paraferrimonas haliotis]|nr:chorismate lyase [Paraferrimonas haliotis]